MKNLKVIKRCLILILALPPLVLSLLVMAPSPKTGEQAASQQPGLIISFHSIAAEMVVRGNGKEITYRCNNPSGDDGTDFGNVNIGGDPQARTFVISNTGLGELKLNGQLAIVISGPQAADFQITAYPAASIASGSGTSLEITFHPDETGVRTALVSITSNDPQKSLYRFFIRGEGSRAIKTKAISAPDNSTLPIISASPVTTQKALLNTVAAEGQATISADSAGFRIDLQSKLDNPGNQIY